LGNIGPTIGEFSWQVLTLLYNIIDTEKNMLYLLIAADMIKDKDIIYYVTKGSVTITQPSNIVQKKGHKSDTTSIATTFLSSPVTQQIAMWIITVSVILGVVLLILLILALIKIGFFNRKKKLELEALKVETDVCLAFL